MGMPVASSKPAGVERRGTICRYQVKYARCSSPNGGTVHYEVIGRIVEVMAQRQ